MERVRICESGNHFIAGNISGGYLYDDGKSLDDSKCSDPVSDETSPMMGVNDVLILFVLIF